MKIPKKLGVTNQAIKREKSFPLFIDGIFSHFLFYDLFMSWCRGFKKSYDVKSATAMSSVVVSRTAMTKECDCYVIQNSDKATKRCHSFHPIHTDTQSPWTHDRCSRCFYNNYPPWKSSFINLVVVNFHRRIM